MRNGVSPNLAMHSLLLALFPSWQKSLKAHKKGDKIALIPSQFNFEFYSVMEELFLLQLSPSKRLLLPELQGASCILFGAHLCYNEFA